MQTKYFVILPWNRKNFIPRLVAIGLILSWLLWGWVVRNENQRIKAQVYERQQQQMRREEQLRREAAYQQRLLQEQNIRQGVQNVMDGFKK